MMVFYRVKIILISFFVILQSVNCLAEEEKFGEILELAPSNSFIILANGVYQIGPVRQISMPGVYKNGYSGLLKVGDIVTIEVGIKKVDYSTSKMITVYKGQMLHSILAENAYTPVASTINQSVKPKNSIKKPNGVNQSIKQQSDGVFSN